MATGVNKADRSVNTHVGSSNPALDGLSVTLNDSAVMLTQVRNL